MISVIIPVYNAEKYLKQCIESVLNQTYTDFELILVDDGSTDSSALICDEYVKKDNRVIVIHQKNQGRCVARNVGMGHSMGEYIQFMDNDDLLHPSMLQVLFEGIQSGNYDFSMVKPQYVPENFTMSRLVQLDKVSYPDSQSLVMSKDYCICHWNKDGQKRFVFHEVWNKLYRKSVIEGVLFRDTAAEDSEFNIRVYLKMNKALFIDSKLYFWRERQSSLSHGRFNEMKIDYINSYKMCLDEIPVSEKYYRALCLKTLYKVILHTRYNARNTTLYEDACKLSEAIYNETRHEFIYSKLPLTYKLGLMGLYHIPSLYSMMISAFGLIKKLRNRIM